MKTLAATIAVASVAVACSPRSPEKCSGGADTLDAAGAMLSISTAATCAPADTTLGGPGDDCNTAADCLSFCCACGSEVAMVSWCYSDGTCADQNQTCCAFAASNAAAGCQ